MQPAPASAVLATAQPPEAAQLPSTSANSPSGLVVVERPPGGLARGRYASPPWVIGAIGALAIALALAYAYWRFRKHRG